MVEIIRFVRGTGNKKYKAILSNGKSVHFGNKGSEHYKDKVPKSKGGQLYKHLNHLDKKRRQNYIERHSGIKLKDGRRAVDVKFTPAWFSLKYLW